MRNLNIIVTVDTEGDNLWDWEEGKKIETNNASFLLPFQKICEKYKFYPVYLTNYEMVMSDVFVEFAKENLNKNTCEIGMHLHAWNSPPEYQLEERYKGNPYIIEYPFDVIKEKHIALKELIEKRIGVSPVSYRSGRWATSEELFEVLQDIGILVDCSVTPGIYHKSPGCQIEHANDYRKAQTTPYRLRENMIEVPMTTRLHRTIAGKTLYRRFVNIIRGEQLWLRPALQSEDEMKQLIKLVINENSDYLMFMIHSSELMPGGNPYCRTDAEVQNLLTKLDNVFSFVSGYGVGTMLKDYYYKFVKEEVRS